MSADTLTRKPIGGPDRGETPVILKPKIDVAPLPTFSLSPESLLGKSNRPPVSVDRGYVPDKYGQKVKPLDQTPHDLFRLDVRGNSNVKTSEATQRITANGAVLELDPDGLNGVATAYFDHTKFPRLREIPGVKITISNDILVGLNGRSERHIIFEGRNGLVAKSLTQFEFESPEKTIIIKGTVKATPTPIQTSQTTKSIAA